MDTHHYELAQISFYLSRENVTFDTIIDPEADLAGHFHLRSEEFEVENIKCRFIYYETTTFKKDIPWINFINEKLYKLNPIIFSDKSQNPNGLLLLRFENRIFAASFGRSAISCLHSKSLEPDFGIKTAMNMCGNEKSAKQKAKVMLSLPLLSTDRFLVPPIVFLSD